MKRENSVFFFSNRFDGLICGCDGWIMVWWMNGVMNREMDGCIIHIWMDGLIPPHPIPRLITSTLSPPLFLLIAEYIYRIICLLA